MTPLDCLPGGYKEISSIMAPLYMRWAQMRRGGGCCGVSANEYSRAHGAQINFGDLTPYLTYVVCPPLREYQGRPPWGRARPSPWAWRSGGRAWSQTSLPASTGRLVHREHFQLKLLKPPELGQDESSSSADPAGGPNLVPDMDQITIKTLNPKGRLFLKIDL